MGQLWTMIASDLRQRVRDRSVLIIAVIVPLALMFVFNVAFAGASSTDLDELNIAVSAPPGDQFAGVLVDAVTQLDVVQVRVEQLPAAEIRDHVDAGDAQLGLIVPEGFGADMTSGQGASVEVIQGDDAGLEGDIVISVVQGVLDRFTAGSVAAAAGGALGLPPEQLATIGQQAATSGPGLELTEGQASSEQLSSSGSIVAGMAGIFLLFTVGFGVLGLVAEREQGTMARLLSMPMPPGLVVTAKGLVSYILGVVATGVLILAGSLFFGIDFGSVPALVVLVLAVVAAGTSLMFIIARIARTSEQANTVQSILAVVLGMAGGAFFPIAAAGVAGQLLDLNPVAAFTRGLGITYGGGGLGDIGTPVMIMLGFAAVCLVISRVLPDRSAQR